MRDSRQTSVTGRPIAPWGSDRLPWGCTTPISSLVGLWIMTFVLTTVPVTQPRCDCGHLEPQGKEMTAKPRTPEINSKLLGNAKGTFQMADMKRKPGINIPKSHLWRKRPSIVLPMDPKNGAKKQSLVHPSITSRTPRALSKPSCASN